MPDVQTTSIITCPECGAETEAKMPTNGCQFFWTCPGCETVLRPHDGDCCVFCSYGHVPCPPVQQSNSAAGCSSP